MKNPEQCCAGCEFSKFNSSVGLAGAWQCHHKNNPNIDKAPLTAMMIFEPGKPVICRVK